MSDSRGLVRYNQPVVSRFPSDACRGDRMTSDLPRQERDVVHRIVGDSIDPVLRPVLGVMLLQAIAESAQASFLGLWALRSLGSSQSELGFAFAGSAIAAVIAGNVGGHLSDRIGRRRPILLASAALALLGGCLAFVGSHVRLGLALIVLLGGATGMLFAAQQALLTDLVPRARHEHAFASQRVVQNLGFMGGPLIGAALLTIGWRPLFIGIGAIGALAFLVALPAIPRLTTVPPDEQAEDSSRRSLLRDPAFVFLLAAGTLASIVYLSYEILLPISLVQSHGVAPAAWGILLAINPVVVVLCQIRLTSRVSGVERVHTDRGRDRRDGNAVPVRGRQHGAAAPHPVAPAVRARRDALGAAVAGPDRTPGSR